jgi:hypothetical protein
MKTLIDLTDRFPMRFDVDKMKEDLRQLENLRWLDHYDRALAEGWKAVPLVSRHGQMDGPESQRWGDIREFRCTPVVDQLPYFRQILDAFACPHGRIRILKLMPGTGIGVHRDISHEVACFAFNQVRLHIPIITNDQVTFFVGGEQIRMQPGRLYYVNFIKKHWVRNDGREPRVHLVLDLRVNDFLRGVFPPTLFGERLENFLVRNTLPALWKLGEFKHGLLTYFWKKYEGSWLQKTSHRLRGIVHPRPPAAGRAAAPPVSLTPPEPPQERTEKPELLQTPSGS